MAELKFMTDYHTEFDPNAYFDMIYKNCRWNKNGDRITEFLFKACHNFWSNVETTGLRCLEYGGGLCVANLVSASPKVDRIVFAEYTGVNREAVKAWIAGSPKAYDLLSFFEYVVRELEGDNALEAVSNRVEDLKHKIKSIVPCDVTKRPIISLEFDDIGKPFDVVSTRLCLEVCVSSEQQYKSSVAELCKLLKPGGYLFMYGVLGETFYGVGEVKFSVFPLTKKILEDAMIEADLQDIFIETRDTCNTASIESSDSFALFAASARKSSDQSSVAM